MLRLWALALLLPHCSALRTAIDPRVPAQVPVQSVLDAPVEEHTEPPPDAPVRTCNATAPGRVCLPGGLAQVGWNAPETRFEERPPRAIRLRAFELDREEVTARAYALCVQQGTCPAPHCDDNATVTDEGPARCIAWQDARTYCNSVGGRLPTEVEWERASGGLMPGHRTYPWGEQLPDAGEGAPEDRTPEGVVALGGGVGEWVLDVGAFYLVPVVTDAGSDASVLDAAVFDANDTLETEFPDSGPPEDVAFDAGMPIIEDVQTPREGTWRVVRGGDRREPVAYRRTSRRRFRLPTDRREWLGFRCAYELAGS